MTQLDVITIERHPDVFMSHGRKRLTSHILGKVLKTTSLDTVLLVSIKLDCKLCLMTVISNYTFAHTTLTHHT